MTMKNIAEIIKLFLDKKVAQNGRLLLSLIIAIALFLLLRGNSVLLEIENDYGKVGIGTCLFLLWLILFIIVNLAANKLQKARSKRRVLEQEVQKAVNMLRTLDSLTDYQYQLLRKFVSQNKSQLQDYEIGGYKAVWGRDIEVLQRKGVIQQLTYGVYEIQAEYFDLIAKDSAGSELE